MKAILWLAALGGVACAGYVWINRREPTPPPPGAPQEWTQPNVQFTGPEITLGTPLGNASGTIGGSAPPFSIPAVPQNISVPQPPAPPPLSAAVPPPPAVSGVQSKAPPLTPVPQPDAAPLTGSAEALLGHAGHDHSHDHSHEHSHEHEHDAEHAHAAVAQSDTAAPAGEGTNDPAAIAGRESFNAAWEAAQDQLEAGKLLDALVELSRWYDDPRLSNEQRGQLIGLLDQLAGTVIYSREHLLEPAYKVQPGEQLADIAARCNAPMELLVKINGIQNPQQLAEGQVLKLVRGPINAQVSLERWELTLFVASGKDSLYAGRFPVGIGRDAPTPEGSFHVQMKLAEPSYEDAAGQIASGDPANPLGSRWIGLGDRLGIHGTYQADGIGRSDSRGSIRMSSRDVTEVFDILSEGSQVIIRR